MRLKFTKKPQYYDWHGIPCYFSACGLYQLQHFRSGPVLENGKAQNDYWHVFRRRSAKSNDWVPIQHRAVDKKQAKEFAILHSRLLAVELKMEKQIDSSNARSSKASARRNKDASPDRTKRDQSKRSVSKAGNKGHKRTS